MWVIAIGGSAIVPSMFLFWYVYSRDIHPEPKWMLLGTFGLGAVVAVPVVIVALALAHAVGPVEGVWAKAAFNAFFSAAIPEECFKFLVLMTFCYLSRHFDEPFDGIVYGATASLGFATLENILYVAEGGLVVAALRAFTAVPGHTFTGVIMGYFVGRAKFAPSGRAWIATQGLIYATILHGLYDLFLMTQTAWAIVALPVLIFEVVWGVLLMRKMARDGFISPPGEAPAYASPGAAPAPAVAGGYRVPTTRWATPPGSAWKLIFGALIASTAAFFFIAVAAHLVAPEARESVDPAGLAVLGAIGLFGLLGGGWLFRAGLR